MVFGSTKVEFLPMLADSCQYVLNKSFLGAEIDRLSPKAPNLEPGCVLIMCDTKGIELFREFTRAVWLEAVAQQT